MNAPTFSNAAAAARWWIEQGFSPIPVLHRSKDPGFREWQKLRVDASNVGRYFNGVQNNGAQNVGVLLGLNEAADVDLDRPEAIAAAPHYLPATELIFGRPSKLRSHWLYRSPGLRTKRFVDPISTKSVLELRGLDKDGDVGAHTVVPVSTHECGELIEFAEYGSPARVSPEELSLAGSRIAAAALLARYWPAHGRHDTMLAMAGTLVRANWPIEEAEKFCDVLYTSVPTHDPRAVGRSDSEVRSTYEKYAAGKETTGFPKLATLIDRRVLSTALGWLGLEPPDWREGLMVTTSKEGKRTVLRVLANACHALRHAPEWAGVLAYNTFARRIESLQSPPWGAGWFGEWLDEHDNPTCEWLNRQGIFVSSKMTYDAVNCIAHENAYHPVKQYLESTTYDRQPRVDTWLVDYLGCEDNEYVRAVGRRWLISAIARIYRPGCQADCTLVLEGEQGTLKSTALRTLASDAWFTDHLSALGSKDSREELDGIWVAEMSELDRVRGQALEKVKSFLTCRKDHYRKSYGRRSGDYPRSCVFSASTNDHAYLEDETGNRRFWPVVCGRIDIEGLTRDRDLLWAEACWLYHQGQPWWLETRELEALAEDEQEFRYVPGPWDTIIEEWIENPRRRVMEKSSEELPWRGSSPSGVSSIHRVEITDILVHGVGKDQADIQTRDCQIVGRCLRHLRWKMKQDRSRGEHRGKRFYYPPDKSKPVAESPRRYPPPPPPPPPVVAPLRPLKEKA